MTHTNLKIKSIQALEYEIGGSKNVFWTMELILPFFHILLVMGTQMLVC
jgi:hypothetical protein